MNGPTPLICCKSSPSEERATPRVAKSILSALLAIRSNSAAFLALASASADSLVVSGNVTATAYWGDGSNLTNKPTSQWGSVPSGISTEGSVGIGTTNPGAELHAYHATSNTIAQFESGDAGAGVIWKDTSTYSSIEQNATDFIISADPGASHASSALVFKVDGSESTRIDSSGNVIIGSATWSFPKALNVQSSSGSILSLYNADTTTYAADTNSSIEFKLLLPLLNSFKGNISNNARYASSVCAPDFLYTCFINA